MYKDIHMLKVKRWKIFLMNITQKKTRVTTLISNKIDCRTRDIARDKEQHYIVIKGSIQQRTLILNEDIPNTGASKCTQNPPSYY